MIFKRFDPAGDFETIENWIDDERTHVMWCAGRFAFPLEKENFTNALSDMNSKSGDVSFLAVTDDGEAAGFTERNTTENAFQFKDESWGRCNMALYK